MLRTNEILKNSEIDLGQRIGLLNLAHGHLDESFFGHLQTLIKETIAGSRINQVVPELADNDIEALEIMSDDGTNLGRLTMMYFENPIPYYYLVYVEVASPFRRNGLGTKVLKHFQKFLEGKNVIGILDNIISSDDPVYSIYEKAGWQRLNDIKGINLNESNGYMVYQPKTVGLINAGILVELIDYLSKERAVIDIKNNEGMVKRTIEEFKNLYKALILCFQREIEEGGITTLARFMFTRFVTKLVSFRRRIENLAGYTGGDSLEQICFDKRILAMVAQPYNLKDADSKICTFQGDKTLWQALPENLKSNPVSSIESLPNYPRPILTEWLKIKGKKSDYRLTIGDILELGFDPTRLKQIIINCRNFIFERIQSSMIRKFLNRQKLIVEIGRQMRGQKVHQAEIKTNPAVLIVKTGSNAYVLRQQLEGVHYEEAIEQLLSPPLRDLNQAIKADCLIFKTVKAVAQSICQKLPVMSEQLIENFAFFVPWNLKTKQPKLIVDINQVYLEKIWIA